MGFMDLLDGPSIVLRLRLVLYVLLILFSVFTVAGVTVVKETTMKNSRHSFCPLYVDIEDLRRGEFPTGINCTYIIAIDILLQLLFLVFRLCCFILHECGKCSSTSLLFSNMVELFLVGVEFLGFVLTFAGACILSVGTETSCDHLHGLHCDHPDGFMYDTYQLLKALQAGAWISAFMWGVVFTAGFLTLRKAGRITLRGGNPTSREHVYSVMSASVDSLPLPVDSPDLEDDWNF